MEQKYLCCSATNGKNAVEKLKTLLEEMGCELKEKKRGSVYSAPKQNSIKPRSRDLCKLNLSGKENPCEGLLCPPRPYVNPPNQMSKTTQMVTMDGRTVCQAEKPEPEMVWSDYGPRNPPWQRPRYASVELRGGIHHLRCSCGRRDGLRDDCPRWDCGGRAECLQTPWPDCCPHTTATDYGVRPPNRIPAPHNDFTNDEC